MSKNHSSLFVLTWVLCFALYSCKVKKSNQAGNKTSDTNSQIKENERYIIYKIDSIENIYLIYARKDGRPYKIVSRKVEINNCNAITLNASYPLRLSSIVPKNLNGRDVDVSGALLVGGVSYYGTEIRFERDSINDIYMSINLRGLCYQSVLQTPFH